MIRRLLKAEYLFRPAQIFRGRIADDRNGLVCARLPWNRTIRVSARDNIGAAVLRLGVYDLVVTETLWRLTDPDDLAVDVGANVGLITAVLAERAGAVYSFEPHPVLFAELTGNVASLRKQGARAQVWLHQKAAGREPGMLPLSIPRDFEAHRGESSLSKSIAPGTEIVDVDVVTLDNVFPPPHSIGVMKVDVEGFERDAFLGAEALLRSHRIRDCVFEEHRPYPTDVTALLESFGYSIFRLARGLMQPQMLAASSTQPRSTWEATSFLATFQPDRALQRMGSIGWRCLGW
jgi:FkbM family methyltransferase